MTSKSTAANKRPFIVVVITVVGAALLVGWLSGFSDPSIVIDDRPEANPKVENGTAFDRASLDLGKSKRIVLPSEAIARRGGEAGKVQLFLAKRLSFGGRPTDSMSIRQTRTRMGCAVREDGDSLVVAIHGEWDSGIEGGARVKLVAVLPDGLQLEQREGLSKPVDAVRMWRGLLLPAEGWVAVPDEPDPAHSAGR